MAEPHQPQAGISAAPIPQTSPNDASKNRTWGNFLASRDITVNEGLRRPTMQDALPAFVLNSETLPRKPMSETSANSTAASAHGEPQRPSLSDERLMLAFTHGSSEAFTEIF